MDGVILKSFFPEIFLSLALLFQLVVNSRLVNNLKNNYPVITNELYYQILFILICVGLLLYNTEIDGEFANCVFTNDLGIRSLKLVIIVVSILSLRIISESFSLQKLNFFEFFTLFLLSVLSFLLISSCYDLISLYLIIEMQALCFYVLATIKRDSAFSTEAGLKYFISGAFISGFYLLGCSILYGVLGTLNLSNLNLLLYSSLSNYNSNLEYFVYFGIILIVSTLLFKIAAAPFHFWSPDVYEGAPMSSTIIFSVLPKISMLFFFLKFLMSINVFFDSLKEILLVLGVFSTFLGTFFAFSQKRLKRLIIYSSIAQTGFLLSSMGLGSFGGFVSMLFFLFVYVVTSLLVWGHISMFYKFQDQVHSLNNVNNSTIFISSLTNLFTYHSLWSLSLTIIFFSIGGIPPFTGFLSKALVLLEMVKLNYILLASLMLLISSVSVYYYIRVIKVLFFEPKNFDNSQKFQVIFYSKNFDSVYLIFVLFLFFLIVTFFYPDMLYLYCEYILLNTNIF
jgi:NADH-quinone oxidoreductase subunit N